MHETDTHGKLVPGCNVENILPSAGVCYKDLSPSESYSLLCKDQGSYCDSERMNIIENLVDFCVTHISSEVLCGKVEAYVGKNIFQKTNKYK